ncbi:CPBP family intramembrane glutamic endopeptidase [Croceiramulus getboli]|nr:CPBP family intramembrane metalloprotease [Flavobacteriaceae bacterium YJPT1-3]
MTRLFYNPEQRRLKAGWRIFLFLILFWLLAASIFLIKAFLFPETGRREFMEDYSLLVVVVLAVSATLAVLLSRKLFDKKSFWSLGLSHRKRALADLIFGFTLSAAMAGTFFLLLLSLGLIEFNGIDFNSALFPDPGTSFAEFIKITSLGAVLLVFLEHVLVGYWEELVFRGYVFQNLIEGLGLPLSVVISCILYGLLHAMNPNAGLLSSLIIVLVGFLRIYGYLLTKLLWLSIGMHIGWNFFQGPIFGFAASGHEKATLINLSITTEQDWLSGGAFGPEGSVLIIPILLLALWAMRTYARLQERTSY